MPRPWIRYEAILDSLETTLWMQVLNGFISDVNHLKGNARPVWVQGQPSGGSTALQLGRFTKEQDSIPDQITGDEGRTLMWLD